MKTAFLEVINKHHLPLTPRRLMFFALALNLVFFNLTRASTNSLFLANRGGVKSILSAPNSKLAKTKASLAINQFQNFIKLSFKNNKVKLIQPIK